MLPEMGKHHFHSAAIRKSRSPPASLVQHPAEVGEKWEKPQGLVFFSFAVATAVAHLQHKEMEEKCR